jgi:hypothetical protein
MDLNVNNIFLPIVGIIIAIIFILVIAVILFEYALPVNISNVSSSIFSIFILIGIGILFYSIPATTTKTDKTGKTTNLDTHFITYILILFFLTFINIIF